jgi:hypothetical protein
MKWLASAQPDPQSTFGRELKISADVSSQCQNSVAMEVGVFPTCILYSQVVHELVSVVADMENDLCIVL